jgi:hypothetical protein
MKKIGKTTIASAIGILIVFAGLVYATFYKNDREIIQLQGDTITVDELESLIIDGSSSIELRAPSADFTGIKIIANKKALKNLFISRHDNEIEISLKSKFKRKAPVYKYIVALKSLKELRTMGASTVSTASGYTLEDSGKFKIVSAGSIKLDLSMQCDKLDMDLAGGSNIILSGSIAEQVVKSNGSLYYRALNVDGKTVSFDLQGGSKILANASELLRVVSSGSSNVAYKGAPKIERECSGSCKLYKFKEKVESKDES